MTAEPPPPAQLKNLLGLQALADIAGAGTAASPRFDRDAFLHAASAGLDELSIMQRVRHIADALKLALPEDYALALTIVRAMAPGLRRGFQAVAVTEFVARHGLGEFDLSMAALADLTRFGTAEFAVRPFLDREPARALGVMADWSRADDEHVRRLASEGSRPRLPWAPRVAALRQDPTLAVSILETLKTDPSAYVRKSVANHLNDITREQPDWVLDRLESWNRDDPRTAWVVRHALRTLIKRGTPRALALIGVGSETAVSVVQFTAAPAIVTLGDTITIAARLISLATASQRLVVDYRIDYARAGGKIASKMFKLRTFDIEGGAAVDLQIRQTIKDFSTRRHYPGHHAVELVVNGKPVARAAFEIAAPAAG